MQRLEPLRRPLSEEMLAEARKSQKSYKCLACLDSGIVQDWLIRAHDIVSNYRSSDAPMECKCDAEPTIAKEYLDRRLDEETCTELHKIEVARWREAAAPAPVEVLKAVSTMSVAKQMPPAIENEVFLDDEEF